MKRLLFSALLAAGMSPLASAQELNFRAVAPRPSAPQPPAHAADDIPIFTSRPVAIDPASVATFRAKAFDEASISPIGTMPIGSMPVAGSQDMMATTSATSVDGLRFVQAPQRLAPMPVGTTFSPPPPQMIAPPPGGTVVPGSPPTIVQSAPIVSGMPVPGGVVSGPIVGGPIVGGPVVGGDCACGASSYLDAVCCDDGCDAGCGMSCFGCRWRPFENLYNLFCGCDSGCCDPRPALWLRADYVLWSATKQTLPALVTSAPTAAQLPLGQGGSVIYGNNSVPEDILNGGRATIGFWFPRHPNWGMEASFFRVGDRNSTFAASSDGTTALGRPIIDTTPVALAAIAPGRFIVIPNPAVNTPGTEIVAQAGTPGMITVNSNTNFWGLEANLRRKICCHPGYWLDGIIGFRHFELQDTIDITENIGAFRDINANGTSFGSATVYDSFGTRNTFNGAQVGLETEWRFRPRLTLGSSFKVAVGSVHQVVNINGATTLTNASFSNGTVIANQTQPGGLLAQSTNIGQQSTDRFAFMPEFGIKLGIDLTPHWRFYAGYNIMYLSNVVRAGDQIDLNVNRTQLPFRGTTTVANVAGVPVVQTNGRPGTLVGSPTPAVLFRTTDFWAQGVSFGMEYRY